jgi:dTDP-4-dehydrorhamnose 3,5-epimerase
MIFEPLPLNGCYKIVPELVTDARGVFARTFCPREFASHGLAQVWHQGNLSVSTLRGTLRGMHFQRGAPQEAKLIRCVSGAAFDVLIDLRTGSPSFGKWCSVEISAENRTMVYCAPGCAHGFQTLLPNTELNYLHSAEYAPGQEGGVHHGDPDLGISWPLPITALSDRDNSLPALKDVVPYS